MATKLTSSRPLTPRELEVAVLFARELTYAEIAAEAGITAGGARYFGQVIRAKLGVKHRRQIRGALMKQGLVTPDQVAA